MTSERGRIARALRGAGTTEEGVTMIELMVTVFIFTLFLSIVLSSLIGLTRASTKAQVISRSSTGVLNVFQKFDRAIRYADVINEPGTGSGGRYVEFRIPAKDDASVATCIQWRFAPSTRVIQTRQWQDGASASATAWNTALSSVFDDGADYPFALIPAGGTGSAMQQLTLTVDAGNASEKGASISTKFVARNSTAASNSLGLVCSAAAMRP